MDCILPVRQTTKSVGKQNGIKMDTPQGSVLEPGLFVVYINDLQKNVKYGVRIFDDDTRVSRQIKDNKYTKEVQRDLHTIQPPRVVRHVTSEIPSPKMQIHVNWKEKNWLPLLCDGLQ